MGKPRGSILVVSLWVLAVLGIFSISISYSVRQKISLADRLDRRYPLYGIAEVGIFRALAERRKEDTTAYDSLNESWSNEENLFRSISVGDGIARVLYSSVNPEDGTLKTRYGMQDEEKKVNLNTASPKVMSKLFQIAAQLEEEEAGKIAHGIVDWRDSDDSYSNPSYGAEDDDYDGLDDFPYEAKDSRFQVLNELLLILGMTPEIFEKIKDFVTVYGTGGININTASKEVLMALELDEALVDKILFYRAGPDREEATIDDMVFLQPPTITANITGVISLSGGEVAQISNLVAAGVLTTKSDNFMIRSRGELPGKRQALEIEAVVNREGNILFWAAGNPRPWQPEEPAP